MFEGRLTGMNHNGRNFPCCGSSGTGVSAGLLSGIFTLGVKSAASFGHLVRILALTRLPRDSVIDTLLHSSHFNGEV